MRRREKDDSERMEGKATYHAQPEDHAAPEQDIVQQSPLPDPWRPLDHDNGHLEHHGDEAVPAELARDAAHDELVGKTRDKEGDYGGDGTGDGVQRRAVDMASEKMVDGDVPLPGELEPVFRVPPVRVELAIGEAWRKGGQCQRAKVR